MNEQDLIKPMTAFPAPPDFDPGEHGDIWAEPKFDGHRHLIRVYADGEIIAWSSRMKPALRKMDRELRTLMGSWPTGVYDGELHLGRGFVATDVAKKVNRHRLIFTAFDMLEFEGKPLIDLGYRARRDILMSRVMEGPEGEPYIEHPRTRLAISYRVPSIARLQSAKEHEWEQGGEGLILKVGSAPYEPGKRRRHFLKIKAVNSAVLTVTGYIPPSTKTEFGTVILQDSDGITTAVKVKNKKERAFCLAQGEKGLKGRKLAIEYQQKTKDGQYRHPMWDHWR